VVDIPHSLVRASIPAVVLTVFALAAGIFPQSQHANSHRYTPSKNLNLAFKPSNGYLEAAWCKLALRSPWYSFLLASLNSWRRSRWPCRTSVGPQSAILVILPVFAGIMSCMETTLDSGHCWATKRKQPCMPTGRWPQLGSTRCEYAANEVVIAPWAI